MITMCPGEISWALRGYNVLKRGNSKEASVMTIISRIRHHTGPFQLILSAMFRENRFLGGIQPAFGVLEVELVMADVIAAVFCVAAERAGAAFRDGLMKASEYEDHHKCDQSSHDEISHISSSYNKVVG